MPVEAELLISFPGWDAATADGLAGDLADSLAEDVPAVPVQRRRDDSLAQDFGATLAIILAAPAVTELVKGLISWLARRQDTPMLLRRVDTDGQVREILVPGQSDARAEGLIKAFLKD